MTSNVSQDESEDVQITLDNRLASREDISRGQTTKL